MMKVAKQSEPLFLLTFQFLRSNVVQTYFRLAETKTETKTLEQNSV